MNGLKCEKWGSHVKTAQNGKNVAHSYEWLKMAKMWPTQKIAQNGKNVAHS